MEGEGGLRHKLGKQIAYMLGKTKKQNKKCNICVFTKSHHDATSFNSSAHIEFPQLLELTQKLYVLEDSGFTQPISSLLLVG